MNKKNLLLTLALPALILCACGNNENKDSSSKNEASTSEASVSQSSSEAIINYEVDEKTWGSSFDSVTNYTGSSSMKSENAITTTVTCLTQSVVWVSQYTQENEKAASKLVSDIYSSKNSDGTYDEYTYVSSEDLYALVSKKKTSNYWQFSSTLLAMFRNSYSSFSYDSKKKGYYASSVTYNGGESAYTAKNVTVRFSNGKLVDIDFDVCGDDGVSVLSHGLINEFGSTSVSLPDSSKAKSGLLAEKEAWTGAWIEVENYKNATYKGENKETGASFSTLFTDKVIHKTSVTVSDGKTASLDIYYSVEGESNYVYTKDSSGKYAKKVDSSMTSRYEELETFADFFGNTYSLFSYDKESDTYKATQIDDPMNPGKAYANAVASFSSGKLASLTYEYDGMDYSFDSIGATTVTLPDSDSIYLDGKVSESVWKSAFALASSEFNFSYSTDYTYTGDYPFSVKEKYVCQGNAIDYRNEQEYMGTDPSALHYYYSLEEGKCYQYTSKDDEYTWSKAESETNVFDDVKKALNLFADSYSSLAFDELSGSYKADSVKLSDEKTYADIIISFEDSKIKDIEYKCEGTVYNFAEFGESNVSLPTIA